MKQVLLKRGQISVEDVPPPQIEPGMVLVRVRHSCISVGTELSNLRASELPLWKRALRQPKKVKTALRTIMSDGLSHTRQLIQNKVEADEPIGYSASGIVLSVGSGVEDLRPGDR